MDTRIRSTMALEKHWTEVEEKRKRDEALRKRKLKEKHAAIQVGGERSNRPIMVADLAAQNEETRLLQEIQEKKRREEDKRARLLEEEARRMEQDWRQKEEEQRKKFDAKMKSKELQLSRLEEAKKKRQDAKHRLTEEEERRRREYEAEMARLTGEEDELTRKIADEEGEPRFGVRLARVWFFDFLCREQAPSHCGRGEEARGGAGQAGEGGGRAQATGG